MVVYTCIRTTAGVSGTKNDNMMTPNWGEAKTKQIQLHGELGGHGNGRRLSIYY